MIISNIFDKRLIGGSSGLTLGARTTQVLQPSYDEVRLQDTFMSDINARKDLGKTEKAVIELLYMYGLRISEVLSIKPTDIAPSGQIYIKTKKTGQPRIVVPVMFIRYWMFSHKLMLPLSRTYSRFYFYRLFKKMGFYRRYGNNSNVSVTHFFRHELVRNMEKAGFDREAIALFLAHRGMRSLQYYEQE